MHSPRFGYNVDNPGLLSYITVPRNSVYLDVGELTVETSDVRVIIMVNVHRNGSEGPAGVGV
jgi:hypothetical protein